MPVKTQHSLLNRRFLLLEQIGTGGMGKVFRAFDRLHEKIVAIKLPRCTSRPAGPSHPFSAEYIAWAGMRHPNIIRVHELDIVAEGPFRKGLPFLALENFDSVPVHLALTPGKASLPHLRQVASQILYGLTHIHECGLIHRDLKPGNILMGRSRRGAGRIKITDFGLAVPRGRTEPPGTISGSFPYISPEAIRGLPMDPRVDLYGLGILLYFLSTGELPCPDLEPGAILLWHVTGEMPDPGAARKNLPVSWRSFIRRLTARDPDDRPRDTREALFLLGHGSRSSHTVKSNRRTVTKPAAAVSPRLALDESRLGRFRLVRTPAGGGRAWMEELKTLASVHGVACHHLNLAGRKGEVILGSLLLRLFLMAGRKKLERNGHGLNQTGLPLRLLGQVPIWEEKQKAGNTLVRQAAATRVDPQAIANLIHAFCREHPLVLTVSRGALRSALVHDVVQRLKTGRLLLVLPDRSSSHRNRKRPSTRESASR